MKIAFWNITFWVQTAIQSNTNLSVLTLQKAFICQKALATKYPISF